ncbi:MAG: DsrE family protein [Candidatus Eisenbacteria bacterium]|nr:DsrE family protein [Candidatus Eisenbacteria bacterium]
MRILLIINDAPYGTEKAYNALRLAMTLQKESPDVLLRVFLLADAVGCALTGQETPNGYYNIERMLKSVISKGCKVKACGSCASARGMAGLDLMGGVELATMKDLAAWVSEADKAIMF